MRFLLVAAGALAIGCAAREKLTESHGDSTQAAFARQRANPERPPGAPPPAALQGLGSQEATIIAESFIRSLAPKGERVEEPPVLLVGPSTQQPPQPAMPRPSVPKD